MFLGSPEGVEAPVNGCGNSTGNDEDPEQATNDIFMTM